MTEECECTEEPNAMCGNPGCDNRVSCTVMWECSPCYNKFLNRMAGVDDATHFGNSV